MASMSLADLWSEGTPWLAFIPERLEIVAPTEVKEFEELGNMRKQLCGEGRVG